MEVLLVFQHSTNGVFVQMSVSLSSGGSYRWTLTRIKYSEMNTGVVSRQRHRAAQGINFFYQMTLANTADRRITGHLPERFDILGNQQRFYAHSRGR